METRENILNAALELFADKGYEHTTFNDIADRLNMTKGAVYWHFDSKEALLVALVDKMLACFERDIEAVMPKDELTFPAVAQMMVRHADMLCADRASSCFFRLMKTQIAWSGDRMSHVRQDILDNHRFGPMQAVRTAIENDIRAGRARPGINVEGFALTSIALWDGLVQAKLDGFMKLDLGKTLDDAFSAAWKFVQKV